MEGDLRTSGQVGQTKPIETKQKPQGKKGTMNTEQRKKIGNKEKRAREVSTLALRPLLKKWKKELGDQKRCPICGESMPETFHKHHIDGNHNNNSTRNLVYICASCHAITYKAKKRLKELWIERHAKWLRRKHRAKTAWKSRR